MSMAMKYAVKKRGMACGGMPQRMAEGGEAFREEEEASGYAPFSVPEERENRDAEMEDDMIARIMAKRMSEGGRVSNEPGMMPDFEPNQFDDLVADDHLEGHYKPEGEGFDDYDHDDDIISRVMRKRSQRNPVPA